MNTYSYTIHRKRRGYSPQYVGDGRVEANSAKELREQLAFSYKAPKSRIAIRKVQNA